MADRHPRFQRGGHSESDRRLDPYIEAYVPTGAGVLDLGCGTGELLERLIRTRDIFARGVEITNEGIKACIAKGLSVYQGDIDDGLEDFDDGVFDFVIVNLTLSMLHFPDHVLSDVVRIGKRAIITYYNAGYEPRRRRFLDNGIVSGLLPGESPWYRNPHIHPFSVSDFEALCAERRIRVVERTFLDEGFEPLSGPHADAPELWSHIAVYVLERR